MNEWEENDKVLKSLINIKQICKEFLESKNETLDLQKKILDIQYQCKESYEHLDFLYKHLIVITKRLFLEIAEIEDMQERIFNKEKDCNEIENSKLQSNELKMGEIGDIELESKKKESDDYRMIKYKRIE